MTEYERHDGPPAITLSASIEQTFYEHRYADDQIEPVNAEAPAPQDARENRVTIIMSAPPAANGASTLQSMRPLPNRARGARERR